MHLPTESGLTRRAPASSPPDRAATRDGRRLVAIAAICLTSCSPEEPPAAAPQDPEALRTIPGLFGSLPEAERPALESFGVGELDLTGWSRSHGDNGATKYSTLDQIDRDNVASLEVAWEYDATRMLDGSEPGWHYAVQANPIVADGTLYIATPANAIVALDAASGEVRWEYRTPQRPAHRGLVYWPGDGTIPPRLYFPEGRHLVALDARTGELDPSFGDGGRSQIGRATAAPAIAGDQLLVATNRPPALQGLDLRTGAPRWKAPLLRFESAQSGCAPWGGFSVDTWRNLAFLSTGNPRPAMHGVARQGPNPHCNSVVAVDITDGAIAWAFQEVAHDLWNLDISAPPALATLEVDGTPIDVVAAATKIGNTLLLERGSGLPLFDYRMRRAPRSAVAREWTAPYQPDLVLPEPFHSVVFDLEDTTDIGPSNRESVRWHIETAAGGFFIPPILGRSVIMFGLHGGAEWPGVAIDPRSNWLYAPINRIPWQLRTYLQERVPKLPGGPTARLYGERCARCHGRIRNGVLDTRREAEIAYIPSLIGTTQIKSYAGSYEMGYFRSRHRDVPDLQIEQSELDELRGWFEELDIAGAVANRITGGFTASLLLDHEGYPGSKPPWGEVVALDLTTGRIQWTTPFGEYPELTRRGVPITGQPNYGGLIATAGGVLFATGTIDQKVRAFDSRNGAELWQHELPAAGSAPPTTYEVRGRQYLAVMATGGSFHGFDARASSVVVFALPLRGGTKSEPRP